MLGVRRFSPWRRTLEELRQLLPACCMSFYDAGHIIFVRSSSGFNSIRHPPRLSHQHEDPRGARRDWSGLAACRAAEGCPFVGVNGRFCRWADAYVLTVKASRRRLLVTRRKFNKVFIHILLCLLRVMRNVFSQIGGGRRTAYPLMFELNRDVVRY